MLYRRVITLLNRFHELEVYVEDLGEGKWAVYGMEDGKLGEIEGHYDRMSAERHISITMHEQFPDVKITIVDRMPYKREPSTNSLMKEVNSKKKLLSAGCTGIDRDHQTE